MEAFKQRQHSDPYRGGGAPESINMQREKRLTDINSVSLITTPTCQYMGLFTTAGLARVMKLKSMEHLYLDRK